MRCWCLLKYVENESGSNADGVDRDNLDSGFYGDDDHAGMNGDIDGYAPDGWQSKSKVMIVLIGWDFLSNDWNGDDIIILVLMVMLMVMHQVGDKQKHLACLLTIKAVPDPLVSSIFSDLERMTPSFYWKSFFIFCLQRHRSIFSPKNLWMRNIFVAQTLEMTDQLDAQAWEWCNSLVFSIIINIIIINFFNIIITITKPSNPS